MVDDGSADPAAVAAVVGAEPGRPAGASASGRGPAAARNLGARPRAAPVVCFTDDDCRPEPGWLAAILATCRPPAPTPSPGRRSPASPPTCTPSPRRPITNHLVDVVARPGDAIACGFAPTSNVACRTEAAPRSMPVRRALPARRRRGPGVVRASRRPGRDDRVRAGGARVVAPPGPDVRARSGASRCATGGAPTGSTPVGAGGRGLAAAGLLRRTRAGRVRRTGRGSGVLVLVAQVATAVGVVRGRRGRPRRRAG